jgi:hypothetical protein
MKARLSGLFDRTFFQNVIWTSPGTRSLAGRSYPREENNMRAIVQGKYSSADVLELRGIEKPKIGESEVLVRVHAAGVDASGSDGLGTLEAALAAIARDSYAPASRARMVVALKGFCSFLLRRGYLG